MKSIFSFAVAALAGAAFAKPEVSDVTVERNEATHVVKVSYVLSEEGIVTARFFNGSDELTPEAVGPFGGEISRNLAAGDHVFYLRPETAAGNVFFDGAGNVKVELTAWPLDCPPPYMAVDLLAKETRKFYPSARWVPGGVTNRLYKTDVMLMRKIIAKGIKWPMGCDTTDKDNYKDGTSFNVRYVTLTYDYYMAVFEATQKQYRNLIPNQAFTKGKVIDNSGVKVATLNYSPCFIDRPDGDVLPMESTSWQMLRNGTNDTKYAGVIWPQNGHTVKPKSWLGLVRARTGIEFDLPTEAEWEYACRGGNPDALYGDRDKIAWTKDNWANDPAAVANGNSNQVHEVGLLTPNAWGLYDMIGNVAEQCVDYMPNESSDGNYANIKELYYQFTGEIVDPVGPGAGEVGKVDASKKDADDKIKAVMGSNRPRRGGGWSFTLLNSLNRPSAVVRTRHTSNNGYNFCGFRVACPATIPSLSAE